MNKNDIIHNAYEVDTDDVYTSFISTFSEDYNILIVVILSSWLQNSEKDVSFYLKRIVEVEMECNPINYLLNFNKEYNHYDSLCENISNNNFVNLITKLKSVTIHQNGIKNAYEQYITSPRHKCKYAHEALSLILSGGTNFPNALNCSGTFFRYNLILYLLIYKFRIWNDVKTDKALLPCNDYIFLKAKEYGITKNKLSSTLTNVVKLTNIAKDWFGERDFWKMYEFLNFYKND